MTSIFGNRHVRIGLSGLVAVLLSAFLILGFFPWGSLKNIIERQLTARFGRPVQIATIERVDTFGFTPTIAIRGVRIPQPGWVGTGDFVALDRAQATFSVWPLLMGGFAPRDVRVQGLKLALVRNREGRTNWKRPGEPKGGSASGDLKGLVVSDSIVSYRDDKQDRRVTMRVSADATNGVRANGNGVIRGAAVKIAFAGPPVERKQPGPWPFSVAIDGPALSMTAKGAMDAPLDTDRMTLDVSARAVDLKLIDAVIEAGLFRTQPVSLTAHVRHDAPRWTITNLKGTIGRSDLAGMLTVDKHDGRTKLDGDIASRQLDFNDLSSDEGIAQARALERSIGPRLVPDTRVDIGKIDGTDGAIRFRVGRIVSSEGPSSVLEGTGTLTLDHRLLRIAPFAVRLRQGVVTGSIVVDQSRGQPAPTVTMDVRLRGASVEGLAGGRGEFTGQVTAHARLNGVGETLRSAVGRSDGTIGFVARDGVLPATIASALGFDAGRALLAGDDDRAGLRCVILRLDMREGRGRIAPLVVDTTQSQLNGTGTIAFPDETLAIRLTGAPKRNSLLRLPGSATMAGTISDPKLTIPPEVKSVGNIFKAIGRAIKGTQGPTATDADCGALAVRALR